MKIEKRLEKVNKIRRDGFVPGVIFGKEIDSLPIQLDHKDLLAAYRKYGRGKTFKVKLNNKTHQVYFKDIQLNMANPKEILHFGLLKVTAKDTITAQIPIHLIGQNAIVKQGLIVQQIMNHLDVEYPATESMDTIELDVSNLKLGEGLHVKDVKLPEKFKTSVDEEEMIANVIYPKTQSIEEETTEEESAEGEGEEEEKEEQAQ